MLQQDEPDDYILSSGNNHSVREFVDAAFDCINVSIEWEGEGEDEKGFSSKTREVLVCVDPVFYRPAEVDSLIGDYTKANSRLDWKPEVNFTELVKMMVEADIQIW